MDAEGLVLPDDTGYRVGGDTGLDYLVLQMHYKDKFDESRDTSGLSLKMTYEEYYNEKFGRLIRIKIVFFINSKNAISSVFLYHGKYWIHTT